MDHAREPVSFIATDTAEEAAAFFTDVMGLTLHEATPFALVFHDGRHVLRVQIVATVHPVDYTVHGWQVANIIDDVQALMAKGVRFRRFDHLTQDALGIWTTPDGHKIAWFTDPSGNILSFTEYV